MKTLFTIIVLILSASVWAKKYQPPKLSIEQAIETSRAYVKENNIVTENYFITGVIFKHLYNEDEPAYWEVRWQRMPRAKGGWFIIRIYNDGKIEPRFGE